MQRLFHLLPVVGFIVGTVGCSAPDEGVKPRQAMAAPGGGYTPDEVSDPNVLQFSKNIAAAPNQAVTLSIPGDYAALCADGSNVTTEIEPADIPGIAVNNGNTCTPSFVLSNNYPTVAPFAKVKLTLSISAEQSLVLVNTVARRMPPSLSTSGANFAQDVCGFTKDNHPNGVNFFINTSWAQFPINLSSSEPGFPLPPSQATFANATICNSNNQSFGKSANRIFTIPFTATDPTALAGGISDFTYSLTVKGNGTSPFSGDASCSDFNPFILNVITSGTTTKAQISFKNQGYDSAGNFVIHKGNSSLGSCWVGTNGNASWIDFIITATNSAGQTSVPVNLGFLPTLVSNSPNF